MTHILFISFSFFFFIIIIIMLSFISIMLFFSWIMFSFICIMLLFACNMLSFSTNFNCNFYSSVKIDLFGFIITLSFNFEKKIVMKFLEVIS